MLLTLESILKPKSDKGISQRKILLYDNQIFKRKTKLDFVFYRIAADDFPCWIHGRIHTYVVYHVRCISVHGFLSSLSHYPLQQGNKVLQGMAGLGSHG